MPKFYLEEKEGVGKKENENLRVSLVQQNGMTFTTSLSITLFGTENTRKVISNEKFILGGSFKNPSIIKYKNESKLEIRKNSCDNKDEQNMCWNLKIR